MGMLGSGDSVGGLIRLNKTADPGEDWPFKQDTSQECIRESSWDPVGSLTHTRPEHNRRYFQDNKWHVQVTSGQFSKEYRVVSEADLPR